jgi:hypothetical protein
MTPRKLPTPESSFSTGGDSGVPRTLVNKHHQTDGTLCRQHSILDTPPVPKIETIVCGVVTVCAVRNASSSAKVRNDIEMPFRGNYS